eukprot:674568_1
MGNTPLPSVGVSVNARDDGSASYGISYGFGKRKSTLSVGISAVSPSISVSNEVENGYGSVGTSSTLSILDGPSTETFVSKTQQTGITTTVFTDVDTGKSTSGVGVEIDAGPVLVASAMVAAAPLVATAVVTAAPLVETAVLTTASLVETAAVTAPAAIPALQVARTRLSN